MVIVNFRFELSFFYALLETAYWKSKIQNLEDKSYSLEMENKNFAYENDEFLEPTKK